MFTRLYNSARSVLSRSPSVQSRSNEELKDIEPAVSVAMVTTRRGTETPGPEDSKRTTKRLLEDDEDVTISSSKRRKNSDTEVGEDTQEQPKKRPTRGRRSSPQVVIEHKASPAEADDTASQDHSLIDVQPSANDDTVYLTPASERTTSVYTTPATQKAKRASLTPTAHAPEVPTESSRKSAKESSPEFGSPSKMPPSMLDNDEDLPFSTAPEVSSPTSAQRENAHIRFGSEEIEPIPDTETVDQAIPEEDSASDSDEAPETVTIASALAKSQAADAEANRAYEDLEAKKKLKRQERAARFAQEQELKRKREEKLAKKAKLQEAVEAESIGEDEEGSEETKLDTKNLPALLPDSILAAAPDKRPLTPPQAPPNTQKLDKKKQKLNRHIKFLERSDRPIKDVQRGSVKVHVLGKGNPLLAPKVNKDTKAIRENWLKGREVVRKGKGKRVEYRKVERKSIGGGFLKN